MINDFLITLIGAPPTDLVSAIPYTFSFIIAIFVIKSVFSLIQLPFRFFKEIND